MVSSGHLQMICGSDAQILLPPQTAMPWGGGVDFTSPQTTMPWGGSWNCEFYFPPIWGGSKSLILGTSPPWENSWGGSFFFTSPPIVWGGSAYYGKSRITKFRLWSRSRRILRRVWTVLSGQLLWALTHSFLTSLSSPWPGF